ncbi:hypothetical protein A8938_3647 [Algoriphagus zhangzhouensis]|uniref:Uncharacterized protein n=1 Tax=Algoriphagus zhangzhouensis TaxID=1073327 RepID=A0A1M7ZJF9_9BACT|nr:hypothetical protein A8938_3647 [Algoriphagus zhangzhouensis]SHO65028.1 hypothetical protein SAMN04488108_3813 [Algoriphagus zhangzhouensis]
MFVFLLEVPSDCYSQKIEKSVFPQDFTNKVIQNLVLEIRPGEFEKKYLGYSLLIFISEEKEINISRVENYSADEILPIDQDVQESFVKSLIDIDLTPFEGCLLIYPVLFVKNSNQPLENNFREGLKSMMPTLKFEDIDCLQIQDPLIVSHREGT